MCYKLKPMQSTFEICFLPGTMFIAGNPNRGQAPWPTDAHSLEEGDQLPRKTVFKGRGALRRQQLRIRENLFKKVLLRLF